jgi:periplasmic divalent cation tolerance protein
MGADAIGFAGALLYLGATRCSREVGAAHQKISATLGGGDVLKSARGSNVVVLVTCGSRGEAHMIGRELVSRRLAACVNVLEAPMGSIYRWNGKVERAREFLILIKTSRTRLRSLRTAIEKLHSYDVPEFIALPIVAGSPAYLRWLKESL